jgi:hypothetical protein
VRVQIAIIVAAFLCAMAAVPFFYSHRMNDGVFAGGLLTFVGIPLVAGTLRATAYRTLTLVAAALLFFCPIVYAITDPLAVEFERLRDGYFLGTGSTMIFVFAEWLISSYKSRKWTHAFASAFGLIAAAVAVFVLLWMVMYFE